MYFTPGSFSDAHQSREFRGLINARFPFARSQRRWRLRGLFFGVCCTAALAQSPQEVSSEQLRRAQEREAQQIQRQQQQVDVHLSTTPGSASALIPADESPCFSIKTLELEGPESESFQWLLGHAAKAAVTDQTDPAVGRCLGAQGVQIVADRMQAALIARGYVTSRIVAAPQNLQSGRLVLTLVPGRIAEIRWASGGGSRASLWNTVPAGTGDLLNLRDVEQALENFKRVPTADADIQIVPGIEPATSDLVIQHQQALPWRLSATADDSGTRSTGKYQGSLTVSYDNWWTLSDLFYVTWLHDLGGADAGARGTRGRIIHYSAPLGHWLVSVTHSRHRYHQTVSGANQTYLYSGASQSSELKLQRMLFRDDSSKTSASLKGFQRTSNNFIDDAEVLVQRRIVAGIEWGLNHRRTLSGGSLELNGTLRKGTGAWGSLAAPEESFGEGTSRMKLWLFDATLQKPFKAWDQALQYVGAVRAQYNQTPLTPQDRFAIGGRFSVRGFDGLSVLSAERGWSFRNEFSTPISTQLQPYVAVDAGRVSGPSSVNLAGKTLVGGVLGLRGQWGRVQHEIFVGRPLSKPEQFKTSNTTAGFSLAVSI